MASRAGDARAGRAFGQRLVVFEVIRRSPLGAVHRARVTGEGGDPEADVSALLIRPDLLQDGARVRTLVDAAALLRPIQGPGLLRVHEIVQDGADVAVVHDAEPGPDLGSDLGSVRPVTGDRDRTAVAAQLARALATIHAGAVVHGGLSPAQVLVAGRPVNGPQGRAPVSGQGPAVTLTGFGVSPLLRSGEALTSGVSPVAVLAPELLRGENDSQAADVYALGATLYELFTGRPPFPVPGGASGAGPAGGAVSAPSVAGQAMTLAPQMPPELPPALSTLLAGMLHKDPQSRPSAVQVARDLDRLPSGSPGTTPAEAPVMSPATATAATPVAASAGGPGAPRSRRTVLAAGVAAALVVAAVAGGFAVRGATGDDTEAAGGPAATPAAPVDDTKVIAVDLPERGTAAESAQQQVKAMNLYLTSIDNRVAGPAGPVEVRLKTFNVNDEKGVDLAACRAATEQQISDPATIAVIGLDSESCAADQLATLNSATGGPLLYVSADATQAGLTQPWFKGEPGKYRPTGRPSFVRISPSEAVQPVAAVSYAATDLKASRLFIVTDDKGLGGPAADAAEKAAAAHGMTVVGREKWGMGRTRTDPMFQRLKAAAPDVVLLTTGLETNALELLAGKSAVLGANTGKVAMISPNLFALIIAGQAPDVSNGLRFTAGGLSASLLTESRFESFVNEYKNEYGEAPNLTSTAAALLSLQVALTAAERSDGTRAGVDSAVFGSTPLSISKEASVIGQPLTIDPTSGDLTSNTVMIVQMLNGKPSFGGVATVPGS